MFEQKMAEWRKKVSLGTEDTTDKTFGQLIDWYLELARVKSKRSYRKDMERSEILKKHFGRYPARLIKPSMVEAFQSKMLSSTSRRGKTYKPATVNRVVALMKCIFNLAIRGDMIEKNPCWKVTMLPEHNKRNRILTVKELEELVAQMRKHVARVVIFGFHTGMRLGEILNLTWDKVNVQDGYLELESKDTKTGEPRRIYFCGEVRRILLEASRVRNIQHNFLFTHPNGRPIKSIKDSFNNACSRAGVQGLRFHDLRHTFNTNLRKAGADRSVIMKMTGHKTESMFHRYNTVDEKDARVTVKKYETYLRKETAGSSVSNGSNGGLDECEFKLIRRQRVNS
ncbi:MAG: site-specific integrase [Deltaproteobacteria bacterium]|nr:site-specific integrase [Deltaproteobacteria bacterium]